MVLILSAYMLCLLRAGHVNRQATPFAWINDSAMPLPKTEGSIEEY